MSKLPVLTRYKQRSCPTCKAQPGENCSSIGAHGSNKGNIMSTSVHTARRLLEGAQPTTAKPYRRKAGRKAWRTRRANQANKQIVADVVIARDDQLAVSNEVIPLVAGCFYELRTSPDLIGVSMSNIHWDVRATRLIPEGFNISILKR